MVDTTYFDVLGVDESASDAEIESAYRKQISEYHPDQSDHEGAADLFKDVKTARKGLIGTGKRKTEPPNGDPDPRHRDGQLKYEWSNGSPVRPDREEEPKGAGKGGNTPHNEEGTGGSEGNSEDPDSGPEGNDGADDEDDDGEEDSPWDTETKESVDPDDRTGVDIDDEGTDGPNDTTGMGGDETTSIENTQDGLSRREIVAMGGLGAGILVIGNHLFSFGSDGGTSENTAEHVEVGPGDSVREAIIETAPGGTVELAPGTYEQSIVIDQDLRLVAPERATFDGHSLDADTAITVAAAEVDIEGVELMGYDTGIETAQRPTDLSIEDVDVIEASSHGIDVSGSELRIRDTAVYASGDTGVQISDSESVTMERVVVEESTRPSFGGEGHGIAIADTDTVALRGIESFENAGHNLLIHEGPTRGWSVEVADAVLVGSRSRSGLKVEGLSGDNDVTVQNLEAIDNDRYGVEIVGAAVTLEQATVERNRDTGIRIEDGPSVTLEGVIADQNGEGGTTTIEGHGISIRGVEDIELTATETHWNGSRNVYVNGDSVREQSITVTESTFDDSRSGPGLEITGSSGEDDVVVRGIEATANDNHGVAVGTSSAVESVSIEDATVEASADTGIEVTSATEGTVTILETTVKGSEDSFTGDGHGISVIGGKKIEMVNVQSLDNEGTNIDVTTGSSRGQWVEISDTVASGAGSGSGIYTGSTSGADENVLLDVEAKSNSDYGLDLGGDSVTIEDLTAEDNGSGEYRLRETSERSENIRSPEVGK